MYLVRSHHVYVHAVLSLYQCHKLLTKSEPSHFLTSLISLTSYRKADTNSRSTQHLIT